MTNPNPSHKINLSLNITITKPPPTFFHCPISLELMRSPVSLCTGVTYDRSSIQRWLDSGHTTCPATMQPLPSTDLVPNLTLRRLIHRWSSEQHLPSLSHLANLLSDPSLDSEHKRSLLSSSPLHPSSLPSLFLAPETADLAVTLVSLILSLDDEKTREFTAAILSDLDAATSGIVALLKRSSSKAAAAGVLEMLVEEARAAVAEKPELMGEMLKLLEESDAELVDAGLRCLIGVVREGGRERVMMVRIGVVPILTKLMERGGGGIPAAVLARAMRATEFVAGCREGLAAICEDAERCVIAVVGAMMRVGGEGREAAVGVLWRICCGSGGDQRGRDAACAATGGLGKILVVMQGDCSPSGRKMAGDLLKVFWGKDRRLVGRGFDSKTMHVMPF